MLDNGVQKSSKYIICKTGLKNFCLPSPEPGFAGRVSRSVSFYFGGQCRSYLAGQSFSSASVSVRRAVIIDIFIFYILPRNETVNR